MMSRSRLIKLVLLLLVLVPVGALLHRYLPQHHVVRLVGTEVRRIDLDGRPGGRMRRLGGARGGGCGRGARVGDGHIVLQRESSPGPPSAGCGNRGQWNCACSVEPARARVALSGLSAVDTTSK